MKRVSRLNHKFVEFVPDVLEDAILYISIPYATASHKCCCGCGHEVVTPLSPTDWSLMFDGVSVSLEPSIGNWSFKCQSHYWITNGAIEWAAKWSKDRVELGRSWDEARKSNYYDKHPSHEKVNLGASSWLSRFLNRIRD